MISAALLALVSLASPAVQAVPAYAGETVTAMKGHAALPARTTVAKSGAPVACHPEPSKGRACRHLIVQAEQADRAALATADEAGSAQVHAR